MVRINAAYCVLITRLRGRGDEGTSIVEWAIFAAIAVAVVGFVGTLVWNKVA